MKGEDLSELEPDKRKDSDLYTVGPNTALTLNYWRSGDVTIQIVESEPGHGVTVAGKVRIPKAAREWVATRLRKKERGK